MNSKLELALLFLTVMYYISCSLFLLRGKNPISLMLDMHDGLYLFLEVFNINDDQHYDTFHTGIQPKYITLNDNLYIYLEREIYLNDTLHNNTGLN